MLELEINNYLYEVGDDISVLCGPRKSVITGLKDILRRDIAVPGKRLTVCFHSE